VNQAVASVLNVDGISRASYEIAALKADISVFGSVCLNSDLAIHSPSAPHYAIFNVNIFNRMLITVNRLDSDSIVKGADKGILYLHTACVGNIDTVGIVSPMSNQFYVVDLYAIAIK
jgi:hypothetical protein